MRQDQQNTRTMFQTTLDFLDANNAVWSGMTPFADAVTRAKASLAAIDSATDAQETPTTGVSRDKADLRDDLERKILPIANQQSALAFKKSDNDLAVQVEVTKWSLDKMQDTDLEQVAERVRELANAHLAELAPYGITAAQVTALEDARAAFQAVMTAPRQAAATRRAQTMTLPQLMANVRSIFRNELDKMIIAFQTSNPNFYNGYFAAHAVVDRAATHTTAPAPPVPQRGVPAAPQPV
jgi:uncharacterized membrane protein